MPNSTALAKLLDPVLQIARHHRLDPKALLAAADLAAAELDKPGARFPAPRFALLLEQLARQLDNPRIALRIGEATQPRMLGSIGFLMTTAANLNAAYQALIDYLPLLLEGVSLQLEQQVDGTLIRLEMNEPQQKTVEWLLACLCNWPRWLSGKQIPALRVTLVQPQPDDSQPYQQFFAAEVEFDAPANSLLLASDYLEIPCLDANAEMHQLHREFADSLLSASSEESALIARVRSEIRRQLAAGEGSVRRDLIAVNLNLSLRTLQRKLSLLDTSFQDLLDQTRKETTLQEIRKGQLSFGEISYRMGFANQSAFQKAFKRWMGIPPSEYRRQIKPDQPLRAAHQANANLAELIPENGMALSDFFPLALQLSQALSQRLQQATALPLLNPRTIRIERQAGQLGIELPAAAVDPYAPAQQPYLAPECIRPGMFWAPDQALPGSLFTLGTLFYEMLGGAPAFPTSRSTEQKPRPLPDSIPAPLQQVIGKLLAPAIADRYGSLAGLSADLLRCRHIWEAKSSTPFTPGQDDRPQELSLPAQLFGVAAPLTRLQQALQHGLENSPAAVLLSGPAGSGKSTLLHSFQQQCLQPGLLFACCRADARSRHRAEFVLAQALRQLLRQLLDGDGQQLRHLRQRLRQHLGTESACLFALLPELAQLLERAAPPQPPADSAPPPRLIRACRQLLRACAPRPLILIVDDAQWLDATSAGLLDSLMRTPPGPPQLLLLAGCGELPPPLDATGCDRIELDPLGLSDTQQLLARLFKRDDGEILALAELLYRKSGGNPRLIQQQLQQLYRDRAIGYDPPTRQWQWQSDHAEQPHSDLLALLDIQIGQLPELSRELLSWAAAMGERFELGTLAEAIGYPLARAAIHLWPALQAGLVVQLDADSQPGEASLYGFQHDNIRRAAYLRLSPPRRCQIHLRLGQLLTAASAPDRMLFQRVNHLNNALTLLDPPQRLELAALNLQAAVQARAGSAFLRAVHYCRDGLAALGKQPHPLRFRLEFEQWRTLWLAGRQQEAIVCYRHLQRSKLSDAQRIELLQQRAEQQLNQGEDKAAGDLLQQALGLLGRALPDSDIALRLELSDLIIALTQHDRLSSSPPTSSAPSAAQQQQATLLQLFSLAAEAQGLQLLHACALARLARITLARTDLKENPFVWVGLGYIADWLYGDTRLGQRLAAQGIAQLQHCQRPEIEARTLLLQGARVQHWHQPLRSTLPLLEQAAQRAFAAGDWRTGSQALLVGANNRWLTGEALAAQQRPLQTAKAELRQLQLEHALTRLDDSVGWLLDTLQSGLFGEPAERHNSWHWLARSCAALIFGRRSEWDRCLRHAGRIENDLAGHHAIAELLFYHGLMRLQRLPDQQAANRPLQWREIQHLASRLEHWALQNPANYLPMSLLIRAEIATAAQRPEQAEQDYEQALQQSGAALHHRALIHERYAQHLLQRGRPGVARLLRAEAGRLYQQWGATAKVQQLRDDFGD